MEPIVVPAVEPVLSRCGYRLRPQEIGPCNEIWILTLHQGGVDLVHDLAHQVAHLILVEARYVRSGYTPTIGIDDHNVRVVPSPGHRRQAMVQVLQLRLPDAHQRQDPRQSRSLPSLLRVHAGVKLPLSCVAINVRLRRPRRLSLRYATSACLRPRNETAARVLVVQATAPVTAKAGALSHY